MTQPQVMEPPPRERHREEPEATTRKLAPPPAITLPEAITPPFLIALGRAGSATPTSGRCEVPCASSGRS